MLTNYDNIVFDFGGVLLDIDIDRCVKRLEALGLSDAASVLDLYKQCGSFLALEEGKISTADFFDEFRNKCTTPGVTDAMLHDAINSFITGLPVSRLQSLRKLREEGKRIFALSNTNPVMFPTVISSLFRAEGKQIDDYFDGLILSFREQACKPGATIFRRLIDRYSLSPERTIFLDDSEANCRAAEALGITAVRVPAGTEFLDLLNGID